MCRGGGGGEWGVDTFNSFQLGVCGPWISEVWARDLIIVSEREIL